MPFTSALRRGEQIFDDSTTEHEQVPQGMSTGLMLPRARATTEFMYGLGEFPRQLLIPRSEWEARIKEMEETKTRLSDLIDAAGLKCMDQAQTNYCWANAPVYCAQVARLFANEPLVYLSPASVAAPIKNFQNQGGWGKEALDWIVEKGIAPVDIWPPNAQQRALYTPEAKARALDFRSVKWHELRPRNKDEHISALLRGMPCAVGLNYWGHEVTDVDAVWIDGDAWPRFINSYGMDWPEQGARGYAIRRGSKAPADDIICPGFMRSAA